MGKRPKVLESQKKNLNPPPKRQPNRREEVLDKIARCNTVIQHLRDNPGWNIVLEDFERTIQRCDEAWHLVTKDKSEKLEELRIIKMAAMSVINAYMNYEHDLETANKELDLIDNPDKKIAKNWDPD